jgi:hypothetical protein
MSADRHTDAHHDVAENDVDPAMASAPSSRIWLYL